MFSRRGMRLYALKGEDSEATRSQSAAGELDGSGGRQRRTGVCPTGTIDYALPPHSRLACPRRPQQPSIKELPRKDPPTLPKQPI